MKMKTQGVLAVLASLVLVACQQPSSLSRTAPGTITIAVASSARTLVADWVSTVTGYSVNLHCTSQTLADVTKTATVDQAASGLTLANVHAGTWTVGVAALNPAGNIVGVGTMPDVVLANGATVNLTLPVSRTQTGTGDFRFTFRFPQAAADTVTAQLFTAAGVAVGSAASVSLSSSVVDDALQWTGTVARTALASGAYRLELTFTNAAATVGVYDEGVNVWDNVTSDQWITSTGALTALRVFGSADFASTNASLSDLTAVVAGSVASLEPVFSWDVTTYYLPTASARFAPAGAVDGQTIRYQDAVIGTSPTATWTAFPAAVTVAAGHVLFVQVTAPDHQTTRVYQVQLATSTTLVTPATNSLVATSPGTAYFGNATVLTATYSGDTSPTASGFTWYLDGTAVAGASSTTTTSTWTWTPALPGVTSGSHGVLVTATDASTGLTYSASLTVQVAPIVVRYDGNDSTSGTVPASAAYYSGGSTVTVLGNTNGLMNAGSFLGWNTETGGTGTSYTAGQTFTATVPVTLYAQWHASTYAVLDTGPGGGLIFYDKGYYSSGWRYLECAPADLAQGGVPWATATIAPPLTTGGLGKGYGDVYTARIVALDAGANAAALCRAYSHNGYTDWYLPTVDELALVDSVLYRHSPSLGHLNVGLPEPAYWASDYKLNSNSMLLYGCWYQNFSTHAAWNDGAQTSTSFGVRAVRAF